MVSQEIFIDGGQQDKGRPAERPPKNNWKTKLIIHTMRIVQYPLPWVTANVLLYFFTMPGRSRFNPKQQQLIDQAKVTPTVYNGCKVYHYQWGKSDRRVLLSHGWNSKIADFRRMINALLKAGFQVEGIDMKAHGKSEGKHTNVVEFRNILKAHYQENKPYEGLIGYSLGGLAAGLTVAEINKDTTPTHLFLIATPSHAHFIFEGAVRELGFRKAVLKSMTNKLLKRYNQPVSYFDLRDKGHLLEGQHIHLIYDEDDQTIPLMRGRELQEAFPNAQFVRSRGMGHYRIIAHDEINMYICNALLGKQQTATISVPV